ncbi:WD40 repeat-like protein [Rickenella mellea]|uniref:WD40 repeat-like protein n=1 Tax=Rickenella mellea TaxID=50990 RepID=A0A4Y7PZI0_9AGAM|nr:WD40 repeat-like protein [Rickenella mellea]
MSFFRSTTVNAEPKDVEVAQPPNDSISCMEFSSAAELLAVGSWDNTVRIYEVNPQGGQAQAKAMYSHQAPALCLCWNKDGTRLFSGGADNAGRTYDLQTGQSQQVAQHDAPIKSIKWIETPQGEILATGSWDKTLKYWDVRTPNPISTVQLPERCYTMDVVYPLLVVGTAEKHIQIYNLTNPTTPYRTQPSPLKWQTRVVKCFPSAEGFAVGSIEGRVGIQYVEDKQPSRNYSFKCHRKDQAPNIKDQVLVYAINDISVHPVHATYATAGSDGVINIWDIEARTRLKTFDPAPGPITATSFNRQGSILAYAVSYDWSKGHTGMTPNHPNKIMLHACKDDEVKKRPTRR